MQKCRFKVVMKSHSRVQYQCLVHDDFVSVTSGKQEPTVCVAVKDLLIGRAKEIEAHLVVVR